MKKLYALFFLMLSIQQGIAQINDADFKYPYAYDSLITESYDPATSTWVFEGAQKYSINPDGTPDYVLFYSAGQSFTIDYLFSNGKIDGYDLKVQFLGNLVTFQRLRVQRDANGKITAEVLEEIDDPFSQIFENSERKLYQYNVDGKLSAYIEEEWDGSTTPGAWVPNVKTSYNYTSNNVGFETDSSWIPASNAYMFIEQRDKLYDNQTGRLTEVNTSNMSGQLSARRRFYYTSFGKIDYETYESFENGTFTLRQKDSTTYGVDNKITNELAYRWDYQTNQYRLSDRLTSTGAAVGIDKIGMIDLSIFPNPASDQLSLKLQEHGTTTVEIFSMNGQLIDRQILSPSQNQVNVASLNPGIYQLKAVQNGKEYRQKVVINR